MVVEDDPDVRRYVVEILDDLGYRVLTAADGRNAWRLLDSHPETALLFTDIVLPGGLNGRQVAEVAQLQYPHLKMLYTTGYARDAIVHEGRLDPGVEVIFKPYRYADLAVKIRRVLEGLPAQGDC